MKQIRFLLLFSTLLLSIVGQNPCSPKKYGQNEFTCVCNATYCDTIDPIGTLGQNEAAVFTSTASGKRFERVVQSFQLGGSTPAPASIQITPNDTQVRQTIFGFGGAFTNGTGYNLNRLSTATQQNAINSYFEAGNKGIGYTFGRVPIEGSDYALNYDDVNGDMDLTNFSLLPADIYNKIPYIKMANISSGGKLKLFVTPWSAPGWMKTNGEMIHGGNLKGTVNGPYYQTWANYFVRDYAKGVWGQTLRNNSLTKNLKLMVLDHNRDMVEDFAKTIFSDSDAYAILDGLALHWYTDQEQGGREGPNVLDDAHTLLNGKWLLYTESCNAGTPQMGGWLHADRYVTDIINNLNHWVTGWVDWNLAVDSHGTGCCGPIDAPMIISNTLDEFEKQPMFYGLGHFSKFITPDSTVIGTNFVNNGNANLAVLSSVTPDGGKVVVLNNRDGSQSYSVSIINKNGSPLNLLLEPQSFTTVIYYECKNIGFTCAKGGDCCSPYICFNGKCT